MACGGGCGGGTPNDLLRQNSVRLDGIPILPQPAADEELYLIYNDIPDTTTLKGAVTGISYRWGHADKLHRRKVVAKEPMWVDSKTEVHIDDAKVFVTHIKRTGPAFIADLVVVLEPELPTTQTPVTQTPVTQVPVAPTAPVNVIPDKPKSIAEMQAEVEAMFATEPISNKGVKSFSIKSLLDMMDRDSLTFEQATEWLAEEQLSPRKGAVDALEKYIARFSNSAAD